MLKTKKNSYKLKLSILSIICLLGMIISGHLYRVAYTQFIEYKVHSLGLAGDRYVEYVHYSLKCSSYILVKSTILCKSSTSSKAQCFAL
ncbi:hypothetical protein [Enterococcus faecium]|uniref:hypothetical protein n=1 Tax=Enterococcus faecium TaxID=1352 RepID=UPI00313C4641